MKLEKVNQITFVRDKISDAELGHFIKLLCEHDYDISIQDDGCCIIIQYDDAAHQHFGNPVNVWIKPEVLEDLLCENEDDECADDYEGMEDDAFRI